MWDWLGIAPYLVIALLIIGFCLLMLAVSLLEKQRTRQLEVTSREALPQTSPYFDAMNDAAAAHGYTACGIYARIPRTSSTNAYMAAWLSPDRMTLACILGGKVVRMNYRKTLLMSWVDHDRVIVTRDDFGETDHSGTIEVEVVVNADFSELVTRHAERLRRYGSQLKILEPNKVATYWQELEETRSRKLTEQGLARIVDESQGVWRYTLKGGWKNFTAVISGIKAAQPQADRMKKKRPGS